MEQQNQNIVITVSPKSMGIGLVLTFLFGPFGMLYSTIAGGLIMLVADIVIGFLTVGIGLIFTFIIQMIWSYISIKKYNENLLMNNKVDLTQVS